MGNILYTKQSESGSVNFFCGNVRKVRPPEKPNQPYGVNIPMSLYNPDTKKWEVKTVGFAAWNHEDRPTADRVERMKLKEGAYVYGVCGDLEESKNEKGVTFIDANIFALGYTGETTIEDGDKSYLMLCGRVGRLNMDKSGNVRGFSMAVDVYNKEKGERETKWYNVNLEGNVLQRILKTGKLDKGAKLTILAQAKETKKETKNPVVECIRFDFSNPDSSKK